MEKYSFQYCPKIIVISEDRKKVLLCKRRGQTDYDDTFSFAGGKMETTDSSIIAGIKREKEEELGESFKINLLQTFSVNILFRKKDGSSMIVPHYLAIYKEGEINLNSNEYSEYRWVDMDKLENFEPKIKNIPEIIHQMLRLDMIAEEKDFLII